MMIAKLKRFLCIPAMVLALVLVALAVLASPVLAHAALNGSTPADESMVASAPTSFALDFSEPVSPLAVALVQPDGSRMTLDKFTLRGNTLEIAAPPGIGRGTHVLTWRVVSSD